MKQCRKANQSTMQTQVREIIRANFAADENYTFTAFDFGHIATTPRDVMNLSGDFYRRSCGKRTDTFQLYKVVDRQKKGKFKTYYNIYAPIESPLPALNRVNQAPRKRRDARILTEEEEKALDAKHRASPEVVPAPVLELQNILFGLRG